ncbi:MAG: anion permease [Ardenticatenaceae bacterium]|nr:anion permease [Ardenticatenaceae bacterium]MCB9443570.1 anion permease [Ardenticatenaceae bacterium]
MSGHSSHSSFVIRHPIKVRRLPLLALLLILIWPWTTMKEAQAQETAVSPLLTGHIRDAQNQPVFDAHITALSGEDVLAEGDSQEDGRYTLLLVAGDPIPDQITIQVERHHFKTATYNIKSRDIQALQQSNLLHLPIITLERRLTPGFWIATLVFVGMLALIALGKLHNTLAALLGTSLIFAVSYLGTPLYEGFYIFHFEDALRYIDWNVIFLIMGMMIVIAVVERTGVFQWAAYMAYRLSGGRTWLLVIILMIVTGIASAFLDNVTTMLLMTPVTIRIALSLGINPLALLMPEVMASNVVGISTLVGTPTNILIGSYGGIGFNDFLVNLTPGVLLALVGLIIYNLFIYRHDFKAATAGGGISEVLLQRLAERGRITEPDHLKKAGVVGAGMILLFVLGEKVHLLPSVTAVMGATALLLWIKPDIEEMIEAVDWTTLVFFMTLFISVGAVQEVGLISFIASGIGKLVGENLTLAMLAIIWISAILSTVIANIPFTAAMLPVIGFLSGSVPGASSKVLFYCLSVGSAMGGNGSLIGASANMVTAGIAERAGSPMTYMYFLKKGFPALLVTVGLATIWLFIRF